MTLIEDETDRYAGGDRPIEDRFAAPLLRHGYIRREAGYGRFREAASVQISISELAHATASFALAFRPHGEDSMTLVALLGLHESRNLYVAPDGQWMGNYAPAHLRRHPFRARRGHNGPIVVVQDGRADLTDDPTDHPLWTPEGQPTPWLERMERFAVKLHFQQRITDQGCRALRSKGVLEDWPIRIAAGRQTLRLDGYQRVSEAALDALDTRDFIRLRQTGGLRIAYAQLMSMRNLSTLAFMHQLQDHAAGRGGDQAAATPDRPPVPVPAHEVPDMEEDFLLDTADQFSFEDVGEGEPDTDNFFR